MQGSSTPACFWTSLIATEWSSQPAGHAGDNGCEGHGGENSFVYTFVFICYCISSHIAACSFIEYGTASSVNCTMHSFTHCLAQLFRGMTLCSNALHSLCVGVALTQCGDCVEFLCVAVWRLAGYAIEFVSCCMSLLCICLRFASDTKANGGIATYPGSIEQHIAGLY